MIFVECKPDRVLVETVTNISRKEIRHAGNKPRVCKELMKRRGCKGLVDEDPWSVQPPYLKKLELIKDSSSFGIKLLHDASRNNYVIVLCPRLEEWILNAAKEMQIDLKKYNLPEDGERFHREININLEKFKKLITELKSSSRRLKKLQNLLK